MGSSLEFASATLPHHRMDCTWLAAIQRLRRQPVNRAPGTIWRYDQAEVASLPFNPIEHALLFLAPNLWPEVRDRRLGHKFFGIFLKPRTSDRMG